MKIKFVREIPQWIISSDTAAYHPTSNTIYCIWWKPWFLCHELLHYLGHRLGGNSHWLHCWLDGGESNFK